MAAVTVGAAVVTGAAAAAVSVVAAAGVAGAVDAGAPVDDAVVGAEDVVAVTGVAGTVADVAAGVGAAVVAVVAGAGVRVAAVAGAVVGGELVVLWSDVHATTVRRSTSATGASVMSARIQVFRFIPVPLSHLQMRRADTPVYRETGAADNGRRDIGVTRCGHSPGSRATTPGNWGMCPRSNLRTTPVAAVMHKSWHLCASRGPNRPRCALDRIPDAGSCTRTSSSSRASTSRSSSGLATVWRTPRRRCAKPAPYSRRRETSTAASSSSWPTPRKARNPHRGLGWMGPSASAPVAVAA